MARAYTSYARTPVATPQSRAIPNREHEMTPNNAGGVGFILDDWDRLNRFLVIGSEGGTYYVSEKNLTRQNADAVIRCIKADALRVVAQAVMINVENRAPKVDSQLFALALVMKHGDDNAKAAVHGVLPSVLRTGTHLLHFTAMLDSLGGWNHSKRRAIRAWFTAENADRVAYQVLKYQNRDGWRMRDVLRVAHPTPPTDKHAGIFAWVCDKPLLEERDRDSNLAQPVVRPAILDLYEHMKAMQADPTAKALWGIANGLPREALPTEVLNTPAIQGAMLPTMPVHALIRNLGNLTASGLLAKPEMAKYAVNILTHKDTLRKSRVHPFAILLASIVYKSGAGVRGGKTWNPVRQIIEALDDAYELAFNNVKPTGKRILIGVDCSGSMRATTQGTPVPTSTAAAAMAITLARLEPNATVVEFDTTVRKMIPVTKRTAISSLGRTDGGGTDVSSIVQWAMGKPAQGMSTLYGGGFGRTGISGSVLTPQKSEWDAFVILTDDETWAGRQHPTQALTEYRKTVHAGTKLVCCSMAANHANVVDPMDPLQFGCAGLDANIPSLVSDFIGR